MKIYKEKEIVKTEEVLEKINCDDCLKEIDKDDYFEVTTSHCQ